MNTTTYIPNTIVSELPSINTYKSDPTLSAAVDNMRDTCKPPYQPDISKMVESNGDALQESLNAMGVQACSYEKKDANAQVVACIFPYGCGAAASQYSEQSSVGCESINVVSNLVNQTTSRVSCVLNQASSSSTTNVIVDQQINIEFGGDILPGCDIKALNKAEIKVNLVNLNQSTVQSAIANTIKQGMKESLDTEMLSKNEPFSDPTSQKIVKSLTASLNSSEVDNNIQQSVANTVTNLYSNQVINLKVRGNCAGKIDLQNQNVIDLISKTFVYNSLEQIVSLSTTQEGEYLSKLISSQENKGVERVDASKLISSAGTSLFLKIFLPIIILVVLVGGVLFGIRFFYKG